MIFFKKVAIGVVSFFSAGSAMAVPVDLSVLTGAADFSTTFVGILLVGAGILVVYVALRAVRFVLYMIKHS